MTRILAIDPGNTQSAYTLINADMNAVPLEIGKIANDDMLDYIAGTLFDVLAVEMVSSYGMAVGREVFETCVWIGRFVQHTTLHDAGTRWQLVYRGDVKLHHCQSRRAKDSEIAQALLDRFASGVANRGKGTKAAPGWFFGFRADIWQAYALAVCVADTLSDDTQPTRKDQLELVAPTL